MSAVAGVIFVLCLACIGYVVLTGLEYGWGWQIWASLTMELVLAVCALGAARATRRAK